MRSLCRSFRIIPAAVIVGPLLLSFSALGGLQPFPLSAGQRGTVPCLDSPGIAYDIYLPPGYSTNGPPMPILYTFNPAGGGMVGNVGFSCARLGVIPVGIRGPQNGAGWDVVMRESAAVTRDIRHRVLFDPAGEFAGGFSGGGLVAYMFSRIRSQHVSGLLEMSGWVGRNTFNSTGIVYYSTDRFQTNLFVARTTGNSDGGAMFYLPYDSNFLASCGSTIHDEFFTGAHEIPPNNNISNCLYWLLSQRIPAGPNDQSNALVLAADWQSRIAAGDRASVLRECVAAQMNQPRSWYALEAELTMDDLMLDTNSFRALPVDNLSQGDFAGDLFYFMARCAGDGSDWPRYQSALKGLTGITGTSGDRAGDIYNLLVKYSYPAPLLQGLAGPDPGQFSLSLTKDTPGLNYFPQSCTNLTADPWQEFTPPALNTNTTWSTEFDLPAGSDTGFYRMRTTPAPGTSPSWPIQ
jgi:hypothetical protein